jgi:stress-induced morphogen
MGLPLYDSAESVAAGLRESILAALPDATVEVTPGSPGHFALRVVSPAFAGKSMVQQQQLVYGAIAPLMKGDGAPVHAIDRLQTSVS